MPSQEKKQSFSNGNSHEEREEKISFWDWFVHGKGTVAEPWPTAEELFNNPKVQKEMKEVQEAFDRIEEKENNK